MKDIYLYRCYLIRMCMVAGLTTACCILGCGCAARNSGLYRVTVGEEAETGPDVEMAMESVTVTEEPAEAEAVTVTEELTETERPAEIYVHICGAVNSPGVYEMEQGDRVFNAVDAAAGFTDDAAENYVNLAQEVVDGMKITIPTVDEAAAMAESGSGSDAVEYAGAGAETTTTSGSTVATGSGGLININTADETTLTSITGIGPTRARAIIAYREEHGAFASTEDIKNVSGIGDSTYNKMKDEITVK